MTVGIVGYGHMGHAFAERLGRDLGVASWPTTNTRKAGASTPLLAPTPHVEPVGWATFCRDVDVVSLHLPWTEETKGLVHHAWLSQFAKPIVLINTARGPIVRTVDLLDALDEERSRRPCLDVLEFEGRSLESLVGLADPEAREAFERLLRPPSRAC